MKYPKTCRANLYRLGIYFLSGLALSAYPAMVIYFEFFTDYDGFTFPVENMTYVYLGLGALLLVGLVMLLFAILSIITNKIVFKEDQMTVRHLFSKYTVDYKDISSIYIQQRRRIGALVGGNQYIYSIATPTKTRELNSHDYWGLSKPMNALINQIEGKNTTHETL